MQNTIHFLISHSISLYCQTGREGLEGTDRDMRGDVDDEQSKQGEREMDDRQLKKKKKIKQKNREVCQQAKRDTT